MDFVMDCSIAAAFVLPDEKEAEALKVLDAMAHKKAIVPILFYWEISNVLYTALKRQRCTESEVKTAITLFAQLPIIMDGTPNMYEMREIHALCREYNLSSYDAAYLRTAKKYHVPLLTLDKTLRHAARKEGVHIEL